MMRGESVTRGTGPPVKCPFCDDAVGDLARHLALAFAPRDPTAPLRFLRTKGPDAGSWVPFPERRLG